MPLGSTAKKLQKVANMAEDVYGRLAELREQVLETQETVEETSARIDRLETEAAEQRALLEAVAEDRGIDPDEVIARAHIGEAEADDASGPADGAADDSEAPADEGTDDADSSDRSAADAA
jgi:chromosome segregation ATPase